MPPRTVSIHTRPAAAARVPRRAGLALAVVLALVLVACGGGARGHPTAAGGEGPAPAPPPAGRAPKACGLLPAATAARLAGAREAIAAPEESSYAVTSCDYRLTGPARGTLHFSIDTGAQAARRFDNMVTEEAQTSAQGTGSPPLEIDGVGDRAAWLADPRRLLVLSRRRILILQLRLHSTSPQRDLRRARRLAGATIRARA